MRHRRKGPSQLFQQTSKDIVNRLLAFTAEVEVHVSDPNVSLLTGLYDKFVDHDGAEYGLPGPGNAWAEQCLVARIRPMPVRL